MEEYVKVRNSELAEQKLREEVMQAQELAERRLATKELGKFRERVSEVLVPPIRHQELFLNGDFEPTLIVNSFPRYPIPSNWGKEKSRPISQWTMML